MAKKRENSEEKAYDVKDKRRVNPDGSLKEEAEQEPTAEEPLEETVEPEESEADATEERAAQEEAELPPPNAYAMLGFMIGLLADTAWQLMGIRLAPGQKEPVKDMVQAKVAIDTIVFIADKLHPELGEEERKSIRGLISDLQINFVRIGQ